MDIAPCKDCRNRRPGCHDTCERYKAWRWKRSEILNRERMKRDAYTDHDKQPYWRKHRNDDRRGQV